MIDDKAPILGNVHVEVTYFSPTGEPFTCISSIPAGKSPATLSEVGTALQRIVYEGLRAAMEQANKSAGLTPARNNGNIVTK